MAVLSFVDKKFLEDLLGMGGGYVLDFSDWTYSEFFGDLGIDIEHEKYHFNGRSKAKRMRAFWEIGSSNEIGRALESLYDYIEQTTPDNCGGEIDESHRKITDRLLGKTRTESSKSEFMGAEFEIDLSKLSLDIGIEIAIKQRLNEIKKCVSSKSPLAAIFLTGSALEGILLSAAIKNPRVFNKANCAPQADGKVKQFPSWSLNDLINAAHEIGMIGLDVKKYSHALRDFRNYIHPYEQSAAKFSPDTDTAKISFQVLRAAIADLSQVR